MSLIVICIDYIIFIKAIPFSIKLQSGESGLMVVKSMFLSVQFAIPIQFFSLIHTIREIRVIQKYFGIKVCLLQSYPTQQVDDLNKISHDKREISENLSILFIYLNIKHQLTQFFTHSLETRVLNWVINLKIQYL